MRLKKGIIIGCVVFFLVCLCWGVATVEIQPKGNFDDVWSGFDGTAYFEYRNGTAYSVYLYKDGTEYRTKLGTYAKREGHWMLIATNGTAIPIRAAVLSLRVGDEKRLGWEKIYPRMFRKPQP